MLAWYREGIDAGPRLQYLVTYLGHKSLHSTLTYLTVTQELLQHACERNPPRAVPTCCISKAVHHERDSGSAAAAKGVFFTSGRPNSATFHRTPSVPSAIRGDRSFALPPSDATGR